MKIDSLHDNNDHIELNKYIYIKSIERYKCIWNIKRFITWPYHLLPNPPTLIALKIILLCRIILNQFYMKTKLNEEISNNNFFFISDLKCYNVTDSNKNSKIWMFDGLSSSINWSSYYYRSFFNTPLRLSNKVNIKLLFNNF